MQVNKAFLCESKGLWFVFHLVGGSGFRIAISEVLRFLPEDELIHTSALRMAKLGKSRICLLGLFDKNWFDTTLLQKRDLDSKLWNSIWLERETID